jgi:hypothetical protein
VTQQVPLEVPACDDNRAYLTTKREKMAHTLILPDEATTEGEAE